MSESTGIEKDMGKKTMKEPSREKNAATNLGKADFNAVLREIMNETLELEEGNGKLTLYVEEVDMGIFIYPDNQLMDFPDDCLGYLAYPVYKEDLTEDASLLVEILVNDVAGGLLSKMLMRLHLNENREVEIKNKTIYETEILGRDLKTVKQRKACEEMLKEKTNMLARVLKGALELIMRDDVASADLGIFAINQK
jgi:hypothetical protein